MHDPLEELLELFESMTEEEKETLLDYARELLNGEDTEC